VGCVCYSDSIPAIWEGMRQYFVSQGVGFDVVLFTSYDRQVEALMSGLIDVAWSGPLAHVRIQKRTGGKSLSLGMRDVDVGFESSVVARKSSGIATLSDLAGKKVASACFDSPQGCILPLQALKEHDPKVLGEIDLIRFDRDVGKHGDTAAGELEVIQALADGRVDADFVSTIMWTRAVNAGDLDASAFVVIPLPPFNHCQFDALPSLPPAKRDAFERALFAMSMSDPDQARVLQLEGIKERWVKPDESGYEAMRAALADEPSVPFPGPLFSVDSHPFKSLVVETDENTFPPRVMTRSCAAVP